MRCEHTDYLELACVKGFELAVITADGLSVSGKAHDIVYNPHKQQCLVLITHEQKKLIQLEDIVTLTALTANTYFTTITFKD
ncbi:Rho-binding antiterminator [Pseudoalteromonas sp. SMS1]|uniref:Rho-binding antiterminator n=1 Tax=Pseudoalteromonas sp. SMS1 TaxID=2908894 RepID=UPI001F3A88F2|nr:Rho-binding antiterminator [Pseudoalteromonas sp. SMS1]MCF2857754.1 Rho-binding antiterminator [Pseudoalteromonas sp. SMS1]